MSSTTLSAIPLPDQSPTSLPSQPVTNATPQNPTPNPPITTITTTNNPPDYHAPSSPPPPPTRRVRFHSPPPSLRDTDTESLPPTYAAVAKYKNHASEAEYLAALRAWAEDQMYMDPGERGLVGFYGRTTVQEFLERPGGGWRSKPKKKKEKQRVENEEEEGTNGAERGELGGDAGETGEQERRKGKMKKWLGRKRGSASSGAG